MNRCCAVRLGRRLPEVPATRAAGEFFENYICVSKMSWSGVQNGESQPRGSGKRERYGTGKYIPVFHDSQITKTECRPGVQNEGNRCPKWRSPRILELKVESEKNEKSMEPEIHPSLRRLPSKLCRQGVQNELEWCPKCPDRHPDGCRYRAVNSLFRSAGFWPRSLSAGRCG